MKKIACILIIFSFLASLIVSSIVDLSGAQQVFAQTITESISPFDIKFNPTGTQFDEDGQLYVRLDFYPTPESKSYASQHVEVPIIPEEGYIGKVDEDGVPVDQADYDKWFSSLPTEWVTNPALCVFVKVSPLVNDYQLEQYIYDTYNADVTTTIDDIMSRTGEYESAHLISPYMKDKTTQAITTVYADKTTKDSIVDTVNNSITIDIKAASISEGTIEAVTPKSIDVGNAATNRTSSFVFGNTIIDLGNAANADGTIDTIEIYAKAGYSLTSCKAGLFYADGANVYTCRDSYNIGSVTSGSKQTFSSLTLSVSSGDYIGTYYYTGQIEKDTTGYTAIAYVSGEHADPTDSTTYTILADDAISLYGTGTESGGAEASNSPSSKDFSILEVNTSSYTAINYFTLTNTGSGAIDVTISGTDFTGGDDTWTLSDTATAGENTAGMKAGLDDDDDAFDIIIKKTATYNYLVESLAESGTQDWGLIIYMPTSVTNYDGQAMTSTITLTVTAS